LLQLRDREAARLHPPLALLRGGAG
jgi:hypothetical protein